MMFHVSDFSLDWYPKLKQQIFPLLKSEEGISRPNGKTRDFDKSRVYEKGHPNISTSIVKACQRYDVPSGVLRYEVRSMTMLTAAAVLGGRVGGGSAVRSKPIDYDYATGSTFSVKVNGKPVFLLGDFRKKVDATVKVILRNAQYNDLNRYWLAVLMANC